MYIELHSGLYIARSENMT